MTARTPQTTGPKTNRAQLARGSCALSLIRPSTGGLGGWDWPDMESIRLASPSSIVARVLCSAQFALVDNELEGVVILASNTITNAVARLRNHRDNHKGTLVHAPDPIHNRLADAEVARGHQTHSFAPGAWRKRIKGAQAHCAPFVGYARPFVGVRGNDRCISTIGHDLNCSGRPLAFSQQHGNN